MNLYSQTLLAQATAKNLEFLQNPNPAFQNKKPERDALLARVLEKTGNVKDAAKMLDDVLTASKAPRQTVHDLIERLCYGTLKQALFPGWVNYQRALWVSEGSMPDSYYAGINAWLDANGDVKDFPADQREESQTAPLGLSNDYVTIGDVEFQIDEGPGGDALTKRVADGLEDVRLHLENVRLAHGHPSKERLAFFVEPDGNGGWIRHNGSVYEALVEFTRSMEHKRLERERAGDAAISAANAAMLAAA